MKKIYLVLFVILSIFVFSCKDNLISDDLSSSQNSGAGQVKVFVIQSRLIGPDVSEVTWNVKLQKSGENNTISGKNENGYYLFSGLSDGTYNITVFGKTGDVEKFTGSAVTTITNGNSVSVNVPIVATKNLNPQIPSTGYATITMDMSGELLDIIYSMGEDVSLVARLFGIDDTNIDFDVTTNLTNVTYTETEELDSIDIFDNQQITFAYTDYNYPSPIQTTEIPTGYYYLTFSGLGSFTIKLKDNLVEIGDGLTTNIVLTENDYEIVRDYSTVLYVNENGADDNATGSSLSDPIAFSKISGDNKADLIYLLSDVEFSNEDGSLSPNIESFFGTISSFGSSLYTIIADNPSYTYTIYLGYEFPITLKNVKLSGSNKFRFYDLFVDETVILDCEMDNNSTVQLSKKSNLQIGKNFSGDLYLSLNEDWKLGDTVINFENGKPENSNFYIDSECGNSSGQNYSSMFYIDDSGKLAKYTDDFTSFAWTGNTPHLVTKTQAKNKTYTSIYDSNGYLLGGFNGISTYDEKNQTWYFINNSGDSYALYSVTNPKNYEGVVEATLIEIGDSPVSLSNITAMDYDNGKLYFGSKENDFNLHFMEDEQLKSCSIQITSQDYYIGDLTSLLVKGNEVYFATTVISNDQNNNPTTHSAIWKCLLTKDSSSGRYSLSHSQTYQGDDYPVPYYLTHSDIELTVNDSLPEGSTFRITDLYSDGTSVYGLLANYIEIDARTQNDKVYMRGSVFKLKENTTTVNANHFGLRNSLSISDIQTAKQSFILPRKIVGIVNKKLIIADDGMIPDKTDCNLDRFILFDLDGTLSEIIDVNVPFTTSGTSSAFATGSLF